MNTQDLQNFPFIDIGIMFVLVAYAIQVLRGKPLISGAPLALLTANKSAFDEATDPAIIFLANTIHKTPDEVQRSVEWLWLFTTGQPLNPQAKATLVETTAQKQLKDIAPNPYPTGSPAADFHGVIPPSAHVPMQTNAAPISTNNLTSRFWTDEQRRLPEEDPGKADRFIDPHIPTTLPHDDNAAG